MESELNNEKPSDEKQPEESAEVCVEINGTKYVFQKVKYKKIKVLKKTAGQDAQLLNDMMMVECIKEPKTTIADLDEMDMGDIIKIQKCVAEITGINPESVQGF